MKTRLISLDIREMKFKTKLDTTTYLLEYLTLKSDNSNLEQLNFSYTTGWNVK